MHGLSQIIPRTVLFPAAAGSKSTQRQQAQRGCGGLGHRESMNTDNHAHVVIRAVGVGNHRHGTAGHLRAFQITHAILNHALGCQQLAQPATQVDT